MGQPKKKKTHPARIPERKNGERGFASRKFRTAGAEAGADHEPFKPIGDADSLSRINSPTNSHNWKSK